MPIRALREIPIYCDWPFAALAGSSVAIDGFWFIRKYFAPLTQEDLLLNLEAYVDKNMSDFFQLAKNIDFVWIWDGLKYRVDPIDHNETFKRDVHLLITKKKLKLGKSEEFLEILVNPINIMLKKHNVAMCRAPYGAIAQCSYFYKSKTVNYIFTKNDAFIFKDVDTIITEFDFVEKKYCLMHKEELEKILGVKRGLFKFFAIASGCEFCPTFPDIADNFTVEKFNDYLLEKNNFEENYKDINILEKIIKKNKNYYKTYIDAISNCKWHPVMTLQGTVEPFESAYVLKNLSNIFGEKLPHNYYERLFVCDIIPFEVDKITANPRVIDQTPCDQLLSAIKMIVRDGNSKKYDQKYFINIVKEILSLNYIHCKSQDKIFELIFVHFINNKTTVNFIHTNTLKNCIAGKNSHNNVSIEDQLTEDNVIVAFKIRKYIGLLKLLYATIVDYNCTNKSIDSFYLHEFSFKNCCKPTYLVHFNEFIKTNNMVNLDIFNKLNI